MKEKRSSQRWSSSQKVQQREHVRKEKRRASVSRKRELRRAKVESRKELLAELKLREADQTEMR